MASGPLVLLVVLVTVVVGLVAAGRDAHRRQVVLAQETRGLPGLALPRRASVVSRAVALAVGVGAAVVVVPLDPLGRGVALVPAGLGALQLVGVVVAEAVTHRAVRVTGRAGLAPGRLRDFPVPEGLRLAVATSSALLAGALVWAWAVASPDDLGRAGRSFAYRVGRDSAVFHRGLWPGSFYAAPIGLGLAGVALLAALAASVVVRRPRNGPDAEVVRVDDVIRRRSLESVLASVGIAVGGTLAGVGAVLTTVLARAGSDAASVGYQLGGFLALAGSLLGAGVVVRSLVVLALPGAADVRAPAGPAAPPVMPAGSEPRPPAGAAW